MSNILLTEDAHKYVVGRGARMSFRAFRDAVRAGSVPFLTVRPGKRRYFSTSALDRWLDGTA